MAVTLRSGVKPPTRTPKVGDHVVIVWEQNGKDEELNGWVLNSDDNKIRIAATKDDDGRPDTDWMRATFYPSEVTVVFCDPEVI